MSEQSKDPEIQRLFARVEELERRLSHLVRQSGRISADASRLLRVSGDALRRAEQAQLNAAPKPTES